MRCKLCGEEKVLWDTIVSDKKVYDDLCYNCVDKIYMAVAGESCSILGGLIHDYSKLEKELALCKKALELACERYIGVDGISYVLRDNGEEYWNMSDEQVLKESIDYFIKEAKEKINE